MTLTVILSYMNLKSPISPKSAFRSSIAKRIYCTPRKSPILCNRLTPHVTCPFKLRGCFFLPLPLTILWKKQICPANLWDLKFEEVEQSIMGPCYRIFELEPCITMHFCWNLVSFDVIRKAPNWLSSAVWYCSVRHHFTCVQKRTKNWIYDCWQEEGAVQDALPNILWYKEDPTKSHSAFC